MKIRKITFKKDRFLIFFFICLGSILVILLGCLLFLFKIQNKEIASSEEAYTSFIIANEMRQSSDDLTKMIRLYVLTGDQKYIDNYKEILSIRNGTSPRPLHYDEIYWDFVLDRNKRPRPYGPAKSLRQIMIEHGFSQEELDLLVESQKRSDALVQMEIEAINVIQGRFNNGSGDYVIKGPPNPELARDLVSSEAYMQEKAKIMEPLLKFTEKVQERTINQVQKLRKEAMCLIVLAFCLAVLASITMVICLLKAIKSLKEASQTNEGLLLNMLPAPIAERLKKGENSIIDEYQASVLFLHIRHFSESSPPDVLNEIFDRIENLAEEFGVEKIKIIGDSCLVVAGVPIVTKDHEVRLANFALALRESVGKFNEETGLDFGLRIGMTSGRVSAGIIGSKKFIYDIWGDAVAEASFLESSGLIGKIQISEVMAKVLDKIFELEERGVIQMGDLPSMKTFFLNKKKTLGLF